MKGNYRVKWSKKSEGSHLDNENQMVVVLGQQIVSN
jgi:hypothetical protein